MQPIFKLGTRSKGTAREEKEPSSLSSNAFGPVFQDILITSPVLTRFSSLPKKKKPLFRVAFSRLNFFFAFFFPFGQAG